MKRIVIVGAVALGACATALSGPDPIAVPTVAVRVAEGTSVRQLSDALQQAEARVALVAAPRDADWFRTLAVSTDLTLSGPAEAHGLGIAFLAPEPLGDTTLVLEYEGGTLTIQDALYELDEDRLLDLLAFTVTGETDVPRALRRFLEYVATDVNNAAAVVVAVAVPDHVVGDNVARMMGPAYYESARCNAAGAASRGGGIRLFYGPEARMYCEGVAAETRPVGDWVWADLVMGRR